MSFSCNDTIGHIWVAGSPEVLDVTLRSDRIVKDLLSYLDLQVGPGRYVLALSAGPRESHPSPEMVKGSEAGRLSPQLLSDKAEQYLQSTLGTPSPQGPLG